MIKLRNLSYEIISVSFGIALLFFFGSISFLPVEITIMGEKQSWFWVFIILTLCVVGSYALLSFYKRENLLVILRIFDIASLVGSIFPIIAFQTFTRDLLEPWIMQSAWFLRYNGLIMGLFLGLILIKTVVGLSYIIVKFNSLKEQGEDKRNLLERRKNYLTLIIVILAFTFIIIEILLFRYLTLLSVLFSIFIIEIFLCLSAVYLFNLKNYREYFDVSVHEIKGILTDETETPESIRKGSFLRSINTRLKENEIKPDEFWWLFIPLLGTFVLSVVCMIIYPSTQYITIILPIEASPIVVKLPLIQLLSLLLIACVFLILLLTIYGSVAKRKFGKYYSKGILSHLKISSFGILEGLKFLGLFCVSALILYYFDYPIYYPEVVLFYLLFGIVGAIIYWYFGDLKRNKIIIYSAAIITLAINFILTYLDGVNNAVYANWSDPNYYSGNFDILFPFIYLHSWLNFILVGIPLGIILSDLLKGLAFNGTDGTDSTNRALLISVACFVGGLLMFPAYFILNNPGGDPPQTDQTSSVFFIFCIALIFILLSGFLFYYIVEHFLPSFFKKHREIRQQISHKQIRNRLNNHSSFIKSIALILIPVLIISLIGTLSIGQTTSQTQRKPLLAYSKGNYYVWYQNSSERVTKNYLALVDDSSPVNNEVELKLAKNEYAAFQLVWRPLGVAIESFNYSISDFTHDDNPSSIISSECCSLRYVDYIIDDEFPDVLMPFTELEMKNNENYVLWFSIRVPYTALAGNYSGRLIFSFNHGLSEEIKINLRIWNFAIPYEKHLSTNIAAASDTSLDTIQNFVDHRINNYGVRIYVTYNITLLETREIYTCHLDKSTGAWKFNWTWWDNLTQYRLDQGMNALRINYPLGIADGRVPYIDNETRMEWLDSWFRSVEKHLIDIGWLDYAYYYFIDEFQMFIPSEYSSRESYFQDLKVLLQAMKEAAPKLKIMATAPPSEELEDLKDYIDIYCPVSYDRDKERWDERLDAGCEFWMYACVGPLAPYPNSHLYNRLYECRILIWQVWLYKLHGFLYWQSQAYYHGQYGLGFNGWGDAWFIYQRGNSLYDTLRWENYLEGLEDYEYLWLLNATLNCLEENPGAISTEKLSSYREELDSIVDSIVGEKWIYCDNPSTLYAGRDRIGAILHELSSLALIESIAEAPWYPPYKPGT